MSRMVRFSVALAVALAAPGLALATSLDDAIALALKSNPDMAEAAASLDLADARVREARSAGLPQVALVGQAGRGTTDLGGFFGFEKSNVDPRSVALEVRQTLFSGGAVISGMEQARQGRRAAATLSQGERLKLAARVAQAYGAVLSSRVVLAQTATYAEATGEVARQSVLRFKAGEIPMSDLAQAEARQADATARRAAAEGAVADAAAAYQALVGEAPDRLDPLPPVVPLTASLDDLIAQAEQTNPDLAAAEAAVQAARAGVRVAQAERLPSVALTATVSSTRDEFFPGYRSDGSTIGVQGRWTLFASGGVSARIGEARAALHKAEANLARGRSDLRTAVIRTWNAARASAAAEAAARDQAKASEAARDSLRHEVRVGQKTTLDLLNSERDVLEARSQLVLVGAARTTAAYQMTALLGQAAQ